MSYETLGDFLKVAQTSNAFHLYSERPTIRILFYTDYPSMSINNENDEWGLLHLKNLVESHSPAFAKFSVDYQNRIPDHINNPNNINKLDVLLDTGNYDEVWFFGKYQTRMEKYGPIHGGPNNELDENEVAALERWMTVNPNSERSVGVLMTGDHAERDPSKPLNDPSADPLSTFLNLGRTLGLKVPRAGKLRRWEGPPVRDPFDNYNTQELAAGTDFEAPELQEDATPQVIELEPDGPDGLPHPLFRGRAGAITIFPDHMHEGEIIIPDLTNLDEKQTKEWPEKNGFRPAPHVVASGKDKRPFPDSRRYALVAVYDGDLVERGRIVADSTWHHYVNVNLRTFVKDSSLGSTLDLFGQYYGNLALWLAPLHQRQAMKRAMFWWLSNHPAIVEEISADAARLGQIASHLLSREATPCEIHELLGVAQIRSANGQAKAESFPPLKSGFSEIPSMELALGSIVKEYHQELSPIAPIGTTKDLSAQSAESIIEQGISRAHDLHAQNLGQPLTPTRNNFQALVAENINDTTGGETMSLIDEFNGTWNDFFRTSDMADSDTKVVVGKLEIDTGSTRGRHRKLNNSTVEISGLTCKSIGGEIVVSFYINDTTEKLTYYYRGVVSGTLPPRKVVGMYVALKNDELLAGMPAKLLAGDPGDTGGWGGNQGGA